MVNPLKYAESTVNVEVLCVCTILVQDVVILYYLQSWQNLHQYVKDCSLH